MAITTDESEEDNDSIGDFDDDRVGDPDFQVPLDQEVEIDEFVLKLGRSTSSEYLNEANNRKEIRG